MSIIIFLIGVSSPNNNRQEWMKGLPSKVCPRQLYFKIHPIKNKYKNPSIKPLTLMIFTKLLDFIV